MDLITNACSESESSHWLWPWPWGVIEWLIDWLIVLLYHPREGFIIRALVRHLLSQHIAAEDIGMGYSPMIINFYIFSFYVVFLSLAILTPYRSQRRYLMNLIHDKVGGTNRKILSMFFVWLIFFLDYYHHSERSKVPTCIGFSGRFEFLWTTPSNSYSRQLPRFGMEICYLFGRSNIGKKLEWGN